VLVIVGLIVIAVVVFSPIVIVLVLVDLAVIVFIVAAVFCHISQARNWMRARGR